MTQTFIAQSPRKSRPIIHKAHDFRGERCHIAPFPWPGEPLPLFVCDRCGIKRSKDAFSLMTHVMTAAQMREGSVHHPICLKCRKQQRGRWVKHELYTPALDAYWHRNLISIRAGAKKRGLVLGIDKDDALGLYLEAGGRCAATGLMTDWQASGSRGRNGKNYKAPSLDRINNDGNYVLGNVQIVMHIVNIMKNDLPMDMFVAMCRQISDYSIST